MIQWIRNSSLNHPRVWEGVFNDDSRDQIHHHEDGNKDEEDEEKCSETVRGRRCNIFFWRGKSSKSNKWQPYGLKLGRWRFPCVGINPITNILFDYEGFPHWRISQSQIVSSFIPVTPTNQPTRVRVHFSFSGKHESKENGPHLKRYLPLKSSQNCTL